MAYNDQCAASGFTCTRINYFSSPTIKAQPGDIKIGIPQGQSGAADNTRRLGETRNAVSNYEPDPAPDVADLSN
jgi:hypothetical protein